VRYLVVGSEGPGFASSEEAVQVLEKTILPSFDALIKLEVEKQSSLEDCRSGTEHLCSSWKCHPMKN